MVVDEYRLLTRMLDAAGLRFEQAYGGFDGEPYAVDTRRMIAVSTKRRSG